MIPVLVHGQTDELNLQKYWKFRSTFVEQYIKIGPEQGESLPAGYRSPGTCVDTRSEWGNVEYGTMGWGDGIIRQGYYLGLLATEYALRKKNGLELKGIRNELYYALAAINRLDRTAEPQINDIYFTEDYYDENLNGFYLREDVGEDFTLNWSDEPMNMGCVYSAFYENNNIAKINDPDRGFKVEAITSYQNVPSLDQMSSVLVGLLLVHKLVGDELIQPTANARAFGLQSEAVAIFDRMVSYASDRNWQIVDINGWPVGNGGGDLAIAAAPMLIAAERIGQDPDKYKKWASRRLQKSANVQYCLTGYGLSSVDRETACDGFNFFSFGQNKAWRELQLGYPAGDLNNQDSSIFMDWLKHGKLKIPVRRLKWVWEKVAARSYPDLYTDLHTDGKMKVFPWPLSELSLGNDAITHYNNTIFFNLGVVSGWWDSTHVNEWADVTENRQLELINALLYDQEPLEDRSFYKAYMDAMPPEGSYRLKGSDCCPSTERVVAYQNNGWAAEHRWTHPDQTHEEDGIEGIFSGLDYMVFHNLYYLLYEDELPEYEEDYHCFMGEDISIQILRDDPQAVRDARMNVNKKLRHLHTSEEDVFESVFHIVADSFIIEPKFPYYADLGISTARFQTQDAVVERSGVVEVRSNFVIAEGADLTIASGGTLKTVMGAIQLEENGVLDVYGELIIDENTELKLAPNTTLRIRKSAKLVIKEGAKITASDSGTIELFEGASLTVEGAENQRIFEIATKKM